MEVIETLSHEDQVKIIGEALAHFGNISEVSKWSNIPEWVLVHTIKGYGMNSIFWDRLVKIRGKYA